MSFTLDPYYSGSYTVKQITNEYGGTLCAIYDYSDTDRMFSGTSTGFDLVRFKRDSITKKIIGFSTTDIIRNYIKVPKGEYPYYGIAYLNDNTLIYTDLQGYVCQVRPGENVVGKRDKDIFLKRNYFEIPMSYFSDNDTGKLLATVGTDTQGTFGASFYVGTYATSSNFAPFKDINLTYTGVGSSLLERGTRGMVKVPTASTLFPNKSFLVVDGGFKIYSFEYDSNYNPIGSSVKLFGSVPIVGAWPPRLKGGFVDPVTNDFVFFWSKYVYVISGFSPPTGGGDVVVPSANCYSAGDNSDGSFGLLNTKTPITYFTKIGRDKNINDSKAGQNFCVILQEDGKLFASGSNNQGQLGNPTVAASLKFLQMGSDSDWSYIAVGSNHIIALKSNGDMYGCGSNQVGQLGQVASVQNLPTLTKLNNFKWQKISAFHNFTFAIEANGTLWSTGENLKGQLGRGTTGNQWEFKQVGKDSDWVDVACGYDFTYAIKAGGSLYATGNNEYGQMGIGNTINQLSFIKTAVNNPAQFRKVSAGTIHGMALTRQNVMYGVGYNLYGELGLGDTKTRNTWTQIGTEKWSDVSAGSAYTLAIKTDNTLWGAGYNYNGTLGLGTKASPTGDLKYLNFTQILLQSVSAQPAWYRANGSYDQSIVIANYSLTTTTSTTTTTTTTTSTTTGPPTTSTTTTSTTSTSPIPSLLLYGGYYVAGSTNNSGVFAGTQTTYKLNYWYEVTYRVPTSDISYKADRLFGLSNLTTTGYVAGGYTTDAIPNSYSNNITSINYATDVATLESSLLISGRYYGASLSDADSNKGYISGGYISGSTVNSTDTLDFSTNIISSSVQSYLSSRRAIIASFSDNSAKGFYLGGITGNLDQTNFGSVSLIDKMTFATNVISISSFSLEDNTFGGVGLYSSYGYGYYAGGYRTGFNQSISRLNFTVEAIETLNTASINLISLNSASLSLTYIKGFVSGGKLSLSDSETNATINTTYRILFAIPESKSVASSANLPEAKWGLASVSHSANSAC